MKKIVMWSLLSFSCLYVFHPAWAKLTKLKEDKIIVANGSQKIINLAGQDTCFRIMNLVLSSDNLADFQDAAIRFKETMALFPERLKTECSQANRITFTGQLSGNVVDGFLATADRNSNWTLLVKPNLKITLSSVKVNQSVTYPAKKNKTASTDKTKDSLWEEVLMVTGGNSSIQTSSTKIRLPKNGIKELWNLKKLPANYPAPKIKVNEYGQDGLTAMMHSLKKMDHMGIFMNLFAGANPNLTEKETGATPLHLLLDNTRHVVSRSRYRYFYDNTALLLSYGADINAQTKAPWYWEHTKKKTKKIVQYSPGISPLMMAVKSPQEFSIKLMELLIENGADVNAQDSDGNAVINHIGVTTKKMGKKWDAFTKVKYLVEHGADLYHKDNNGEFIFNKILNASSRFRSKADLQVTIDEIKAIYEDLQKNKYNGRD